MISVLALLLIGCPERACDDPGELIEVVFPTQVLAVGAPISPGLLVVRKVPRETVPANALLTVEDVQMRTPITTLFPDEPVMAERLYKKDVARQFSTALKQNERAVPLPSTVSLPDGDAVRIMSRSAGTACVIASSATVLQRNPVMVALSAENAWRLAQATPSTVWVEALGDDAAAHPLCFL